MFRRLLPLTLVVASCIPAANAVESVPSPPPSPPPPDPLALPASCVPSTACRVKGELPVHRGRRRASVFSRDAKRVYFHGTAYEEFDPVTFKVFATEGCHLHLDSYVVDRHDVYTAGAVSCGPSTCGLPDYHGYSWGPLSLRHPEAFTILDGGYARDGDRVISTWGTPMPDVDASSFAVFACDNDVIVGRDRRHFYIDGEVVTREALLTATATPPR